jgi:pimeloyl-ACP methyl ester carboxylesterase
VGILLSGAAFAQDRQTDDTPPTIRFTTVEEGIKLEVIDWGGSGPPLVLLAGLGDTAHVFDKFALRLNPTYHVYGITRRGFGASSAPSTENGNYSANRLGDDVVAVIDALKLNRPLLAGHSVAGEELSSIASRHPEKIAALIYIDAAYQYALYDEKHEDLVLDSISMRNELDQLHLGTLHLSSERLKEVLVQTQRLQGEVQQRIEDLSSLSAPHPVNNPVIVAILDGQQKYTHIDVPVLAIFNVPHTPAFLRLAENQAQAFKSQVPSARVVLIQNADHYLFRTNEGDVLREINDFVGWLHLRRVQDESNIDSVRFIIDGLFKQCLEVVSRSDSPNAESDISKNVQPGSSLAEAR